MHRFGQSQAEFERKIQLWHALAVQKAAAKKARADTSTTRVITDPSKVRIPESVEDVLDIEDIAAKIIRAGQLCRGELPIPVPAATGTAAAIINAGVVARAGGPTLSAPTGLAAEILLAGEKRRQPRGG